MRDGLVTTISQPHHTCLESIPLQATSSETNGMSSYLRNHEVTIPRGVGMSRPFFAHARLSKRLVGGVVIGPSRYRYNHEERDIDQIETPHSPNIGGKLSCPASMIRRTREARRCTSKATCRGWFYDMSSDLI